MTASSWTASELLAAGITDDQAEAEALASVAPEPENRRVHIVGVRLNDNERARVRERATACGLPLSTMARRSMLGVKIVRDREASRLRADLLAEAITLHADLGRCAGLVKDSASAIRSAGHAGGLPLINAALGELRAAAAAIADLLAIEKPEGKNDIQPRHQGRGEVSRDGEEPTKQAPVFTAGAPGR